MVRQSHVAAKLQSKQNILGTRVILSFYASFVTYVSDTDARTISTNRSGTIDFNSAIFNAFLAQIFRIKSKNCPTGRPVLARKRALNSAEFLSNTRAPLLNCVNKLTGAFGPNGRFWRVVGRLKFFGALRKNLKCANTPIFYFFARNNSVKILEFGRF